MTANGQEILESHACFLSLACDDLIVTAVMKRHAALEARRKKSEVEDKCPRPEGRMSHG